MAVVDKFEKFKKGASSGEGTGVLSRFASFQESSAPARQRIAKEDELTKFASSLPDDPAKLGNILREVNADPNKRQIVRAKLRGTLFGNLQEGSRIAVDEQRKLAPLAGAQEFITEAGRGIGRGLIGAESALELPGRLPRAIASEIIPGGKTGADVIGERSLAERIAPKLSEEAFASPLQTGFEAASLVPAGGATPVVTAVKELGVREAVKLFGREAVKDAISGAMVAGGTSLAQGRTGKESLREAGRGAVISSALGRAGSLIKPKGKISTPDGLRTLDRELDTILNKEQVAISRETVKSVVGEKTYHLQGKTKTPASFAKHFDETIQRKIEELEASPETQQALAEAGGNLRIPNLESLRVAQQMGPLSDEVFYRAKPGVKIDTVTIARASVTAENIAEDYASKLRAGTNTTADDQRISKVLAGHAVLNGEAGRALQIQNSFVNRSLSIAKRIEAMKESFKGRPMTEGERKFLAKGIDELEKIQERWRDTPLGKFASGIEEYATAAKLTSPLTHFVNGISNSLTLAYRGSLERPVAAIIGSLKRETGLGELKYAFGTASGWKSATQKMFQILRDKGETFAQEGRKGVIPSQLGGQVIRFPFRMLEAADEFGKTILRDSEIHTSAYQRAFQEGARGKKLASRIKELIEHPDPAMLSRADKVAKEFTFQEDPGRAVEAIISLVNAIPGGKLLVPFIKTPTNIFSFLARRSPLGLIAPKNWSDIKAGGREQTEAAARLFTGLSLSVGAWMWVKELDEQGKITGGVPANDGERELFYAQGKRPYSVKVGDKWISYQRLQPAGLYILQAKSLNDAIKNNEQEGIGNILAALTTTVAQGFTELPFVSGVNALMDAVNDPGKYGEKLGQQLVGGLIPTGFADVARALDTESRKPTTFTESLMVRIPGQREKVPARINPITGEIQQEERSPWMRGLLKVVSTERRNPVFDELDRVGQKTQKYPSPPGETQAGRKLSPKEYNAFSEESGKIFFKKLERTFADKRYQELSDDDKASVIKSLNDNAEKEAREKMFGDQEKAAKKKLPKFD